MKIKYTCWIYNDGISDFVDIGSVELINPVAGQEIEVDGVLWVIEAVDEELETLEVVGA